MLIKLHVLAAASRLRIFTIAELARAANVPEGTVHTVFQRIPSDWFNKVKTTTGAPGGQPYRLELTAAGVAGISERLGKLPSSEPLAAPLSEGMDKPMGIATARASLTKLAASASPDGAEELRQAALHSLAWAEAELDDGDFAAAAETLREEILAIRRQLATVPSERDGKDYSQRIHRWRTYIASRLRTVAGLFDGHRNRDLPSRAALASGAGVFISYFGSDATAREVATFATDLATRLQLLSHDRTEPFEAHELLSMSELTVAAPRQLFLCVSTPSASEELQLILKQARLLIDRRCFTRESWVLDCGYNKDLESVTRRFELNYEPHAREFSHLARWANLILANAARSPLSPGVMPFEDDVKSDKPPAARLTIRKLPASAFQSWTTRHSKGATIPASVSQVDAKGATINFGGGVYGYLKASKLSPEPVDDARVLLKLHQKVLARYAESDHKRRTITVLVNPVRKDETAPGSQAPGQSDNYAAHGTSTKKMRPKSGA